MKRFTYSLICILGVSCNSPLGEEEHWSIGRFKIYERDAALRSQVVHVYYPQNTIADAGLIQLKNAYVLATILENNGHAINDHKLSNESARIDASSRDPKTLKMIKDIFLRNGSLDQEAYYKVFILPSYVDRALPTVFQELPLHAETLSKAQAFYATVLEKPETMTKEAEKAKLALTKLCLSPAEGFSFTKEGDEKKHEKGNSLVDLSKVPNEKLRETVMAAMESTSDALVSKWFVEIVGPTKSGSIVTKIVDYYSSWMVMRLVEKAKNRACFQTVMFPKETFDTWLEKERAKVSVRQVSK